MSFVFYPKRVEGQPLVKRLKWLGWGVYHGDEIKTEVSKLNPQITDFDNLSWLSFFSQQGCHKGIEYSE